MRWNHSLRNQWNKHIWILFSAGRCNKVTNNSNEEYVGTFVHIETLSYLDTANFKKLCVISMQCEECVKATTVIMAQTSLAHVTSTLRYFRLGTTCCSKISKGGVRAESTRGKQNISNLTRIERILLQAGPKCLPFKTARPCTKYGVMQTIQLLLSHPRCCGHCVTAQTHLLYRMYPLMAYLLTEDYSNDWCSISLPSFVLSDHTSCSFSKDGQNRNQRMWGQHQSWWHSLGEIKVWASKTFGRGLFGHVELWRSCPLCSDRCCVKVK